MSDQATNSSHAQHYIDAAAQAHRTIVRLRAENAALNALVTYLKARGA